MVNGSAVKVGGKGRSIHFTLDDTVPLAELERGLRAYLDGANGFFHGARVRLDAGRRLANREDVARLRHLLEVEYQLEIAEMRSGAEQLEIGLSHATGVCTVILPRESAPFLDRTLLVKGARRSGTTTYHEGNLVVLGDVNPGAEVTAAGDVVVFGQLCGVACAGVNGDEEAVVAALALQPTQLRIGRHLEVALSERKRKRTRGVNPEVAFVQRGQIVVEPFSGQFHSLVRGWEAT